MEIKIIVNSLVDLFFPMRCIHCQEVIQSTQILCTNCSEKIPFTYWEFNKENTVYHTLKNLCKIENAYSLLHFKHNNITQKIIHEMKYKNRPDIGFYLADLIKFDLKTFDGIIPIPLHTKRMKKRGYNQIGCFSEQLAKNSNIPYIADGLIRVKYNSSQVRENKENRIHNLENAFQINPNLVPGHYILIDDIITTGSTIVSAVKEFNNLENFNISVISIACA